MTILSFGPTLGINLSLFEYLKMKKTNLLLSSILSGLITSVITNPFEIIRFWSQIKKESVKQIFIDLIRKEGVISLWKGSTTRLIYMTLQSTINLTLFDLFN